MGKLVRFLNERGFATCGVPELRRFFAYLNSGHLEPEGRWGNPRQIKPLRPVTIQTYHKHLRTLFNWLVHEEVLLVSPMEKIPTIVARPDQVQPYTCNLRMQDVDYDARRCRVLGKGNKYRTVCFGKNTAKALWQYIREEAREENAPLFLADRGIGLGNRLHEVGYINSSNGWAKEQVCRPRAAALILSVTPSPFSFSVLAATHSP